MILIFTVMLVFSSVAMAGLLYAKHWELTTGRIMFADRRPQVGAFFHRHLTFIEQRMPLLINRQWQRFLVWMQASVRAALAHALLLIEQTLERALHLIRHTTTPSPYTAGQASVFLREVAEHKKKIMHRAQLERFVTKN